MDVPSFPSQFCDENPVDPGLRARFAAQAASVRATGAGTVAVESAQAVEGAPPRLVIRGESSTQEQPESGESFALLSNDKGRLKAIAHPRPLPNGVATAALVDYLNCSFPFGEGRPALPAFFARLFEAVGAAFAPAKDRNRGLHGYKHSFSLGSGSAFFAFGGNQGTGFLTFPGEACHQIPDWPGLVAYLRDELHARITRFDGAVDDFRGKHSVDDAVRMYQEGLFNVGGRPPQIDQRGNWLAPDGTGRTFYVGKRRNGKTLRVYEKGMQQGVRFHPWVRWELELHNNDRVIPWEALLAPGKYVAGAYPKALGWMSEEQTRIRTLQNTAVTSYEALTYWASVGYGKLIDTMLKVEGSPEKVVALLRRPGLPDRLDLPELPGHGKVLPPCAP